MKYIALATSDDGIHWTRPELGIIDIDGSTANNLVFDGFPPAQRGVHGFAPFLDTNPACPPEARFVTLIDQRLGSRETFGFSTRSRPPGATIRPCCWAASKP